MTYDQQHPMIPPNILLNNWESDWFAEREHADVLLIQAYQAGADAELEACCEWVETDLYSGYGIPHEQLRAARRPNPPTLAEQGMRILTENGTTLDGRIELDPEDIKTFHAVLVRLQQLEDS
jgi:hypothetical protein